MTIETRVLLFDLVLAERRCEHLQRRRLRVIRVRECVRELRRLLRLREWEARAIARCGRRVTVGADRGRCAAYGAAIELLAMTLDAGNKELLGGAKLIAIDVAAMLIAGNYAFGTTLRMGPAISRRCLAPSCRSITSAARMPT